MIVLDSSALYALVDANDAHHREAVAALDADRGPLLLPAAIISEVAYLVESRLRPDAADLVLTDMIEGRYACDFDSGDLGRVRELVSTYRDLALGIADASVIACAERLRAPVLTFDRRDFDVVARAGTIRLLP